MLNTQNIIPSLVNNSQDALMNLFTITFTLNSATGKEEGLAPSLTVRTTVFNSPSFQENVVTVPYMNTSIQVLSPGISINRTLQLQLRIDDKYDVVNFLRGRVLADENADFEYDENKSFDMTVLAYNAPQQVISNNSANYYLNPVYQWKFKNCYFTNIPSLSYNYQNSTPGTFMLSILYNTYEEGAPEEE